MRIRVTREIPLPNPVVLERFRRLPELGPKVLFFSGGSALREISRELTGYTHNSIHIITPFDSGGSSAKIRQCFNMLAVGDVRNRLMALADTSFHGNPEIFALFAHRLPKDQDQRTLFQELSAMAEGDHSLIAAVPDPMRKIIRTHLHHFVDQMPSSFDLRGASIGNLILTAGYLTNREHLDPVIYIFSKLVRVLGEVRPVTSTNAQLEVRLQNGETICCQHRFTGKEGAPITSPIEAIRLVRSEDDPCACTTTIRKKVASCIAGAELICYPIGSFYSSLIANLLPEGVGRSIAANACPKIFTPNPMPDLEVPGVSLAEQVQRLIHYARKDDPEGIGVTDVLNYIIVDTKNGSYQGALDLDFCSRHGITVIDTPLITRTTAPRIDPGLFTRTLLSMC